MTHYTTKAGKGTGWVRDPDVSQAQWASELFAGLSPVTDWGAPKSVSYADRVIEVLDQGQTQSCWANATAQAIRLRQVLQAVKSQNDPTPAIPLMSRLWLYWQGRKQVDQEAIDNGIYPQAGYDGLEQDGYCLDAYWPWDNPTFPPEFAVKQPPPLLAFEKAFDQQKRLGAYRCSDEGGALRQQQIQAALDQQMPVIIGLMIDRNYENLTNGVWDYEGGEILGGHMNCLTGYGPLGVEDLNSWGPNWGVGGFGIVGWKTICNPQICSDVYAFKDVPLVSG